MTDYKTAIVARAIEDWLHPDNSAIKKAYKRTIEDGLFPAHDVSFQLDYIRNYYTKDALDQWVQTYKPFSSPGKVLALHAGNLPLVGFQDVVAILLTGAQYMGKLSRKDPWLLASFLECYCAVSGEDHHQWSTSLDDLDGTADHVMFTGSESSVPGVKNQLSRLNLFDQNTRWLIRKAHFSMAYIDEPDQKKLKDLVDGMLRFEGKGCRSIATIVAPFSFMEKACNITDYMEIFWMQNPPRKKRSALTSQHIALNNAIGRLQYPVEYLLIQESEEPDFSNEDVIHWIKGDWDTAKQIAKTSGKHLQCVYHPDKNPENVASDLYTEPLHQAQTPAANWKPDGIDTISWLISAHKVY